MKALTIEQRLDRLRNIIERQAGMIRSANVENIKLTARTEKAEARVSALEAIIDGLRRLPHVEETLAAMKEQTDG